MATPQQGNTATPKKNMSKPILSLGLGTAAIGRPQYINIRQDTAKDFSLTDFREAGRKILETAYEEGIRYFDTAPGYGLAEQLVLDWVHVKQDPTIEVATKWGYTYVANFDPEAEIHEIKEHSLTKLKEQWKQSKKLLPYLKVYQIHSATFETGVLANQAILNHLAEVKANHNLLMGITTSGTNQVAVIQKALEVVINGIPLFDAFQVTYNILDQSLAEINQKLLQENKRMIIKEALANGRIFPNEKYPHYGGLYKILGSLAKKYKVGIDVIALRFCMDSLMPYKVLSGAAKAFHLTENIKTEQFQLTEEEVELLKQFAITPTAYWQERKELTWN